MEENRGRQTIQRRKIRSKRINRKRKGTRNRRKEASGRKKRRRRREKMRSP